MNWAMASRDAIWSINYWIRWWHDKWQCPRSYPVDLQQTAAPEPSTPVQTSLAGILAPIAFIYLFAWLRCYNLQIGCLLLAVKSHLTFCKPFVGWFSQVMHIWVHWLFDIGSTNGARVGQDSLFWITVAQKLFISGPITKPALYKQSFHNI